MSVQEVFLILLTVCLLGGIISGLPVSFVLIAVPFLIAMVGALFDIFDLAFLAAFPSRVFGILTNPVIVSVPLFVIMGALLLPEIEFIRDSLLIALLISLALEPVTRSY